MTVFGPECRKRFETPPPPTEVKAPPGRARGKGGPGDTTRGAGESCLTEEKYMRRGPASVISGIEDHNAAIIISILCGRKAIAAIPNIIH